MADDKLKTPLNSSPCMIGDLTLDILISEDEDMPNKVTQFPVEAGSPAFDHVVNDPITLNITGFVTNAPIRTHPGTADGKARVTKKGEDQLTGAEINFAELALAYLREIRLAGKAVKVTTKRGSWDSMLVQRVSRTKNKETGDALIFSISLIEFRQVKLLFVAAPTKRTTSQRAQPRSQIGKKGTAPGPKTDEQYESIGYKLVHGFGKTFFGKGP